MKVLILSNKALGFYKFRKELVIELIAKGFDVTLVFPDEEIKAKFIEMGCKYIPIEIDRRGTNPITDFRLIKKYRTIILREHPQVVLTYTIKPNIYGGLVCKKTSIPYIANITGLGSSIENGGLLSNIARVLYRNSLKEAYTVFFQNQANAKAFLETKMYNGRFEVIPGSGVNTVEFPLLSYPDEECAIKFLFIGRIMKEKGIDELLNAFEQFHNRFPNVSLDLVGDLEDNYQEKMSAVNKTNYMYYHGEQIDVHRFYKETHCVVLPSYHEGTANVMLEAAASGRPVITTDVPGCIETFDDGKSGFACKSRDSHSLLDALIKFIQLPYEKKKEMGLCGRKKIENEYDRRIVTQAYMREIMRIKQAGDSEYGRAKNP